MSTWGLLMSRRRSLQSAGQSNLSRLLFVYFYLLVVHCLFWLSTPSLNHFGWKNILVSAASTPSTLSSASFYESVRALDEYGHAKQLQYAQAAADTQGRLVIIWKFNGDFVVFSILPSQLVGPTTYRRTTPSLTEVAISQPVVLINESPNNNNNNNGSNVQQHQLSIAAVGTGIQADVRDWITQLQRYALLNWWDTWNTAATATSLVEISSHLMRSFWKYNSDKMLLPVGMSNSNDNDDNSENSWARPRGLRGVILSLGNNDDASSLWYVIEPSGLVQDLSRFSKPVFCMGQYSALINERLQQDYASVTTVDDFVTLLKRVFDQVLGSSSSTSTPATTTTARTLLIETISTQGISRRIVDLAEPSSS